MDILHKLQNQPEHIRKAIFWLVVILISIFLSVKIIKDFQKGLKNFRGEGLKETAQMLSLEKEINPVRNFREIWLDLLSSHKISNGVNGLPKIEIPKSEIENLKNLLEKINEKSNEQ